MESPRINFNYVRLCRKQNTLHPAEHITLLRSLGGPGDGQGYDNNLIRSRPFGRLRSNPPDGSEPTSYRQRVGLAMIHHSKNVRALLRRFPFLPSVLDSQKHSVHDVLVVVADVVQEKRDKL